jgi:hypothetical protein
MTEADEMIKNAMDYFSKHIGNNVREWKILYTELPTETLCCRETNYSLLVKLKKDLRDSSLMHLWTPENIFKIIDLVHIKKFENRRL